MVSVDYNEKVNEIKGYLTDTISDIMIREASKEYIRITKEDSERYAHMSIIAGLFYYFEPLQKIYFYYTFDKNVRWALSGNVKRYYTLVMNSLYDNCRTDINCTMELLGPSYLCDSSYCAKGSNVSRYITPYTIGYWKGTNKNYEYINDPGLSVYHKKKYDLAHNILDSSRGSRPYLKELKAVRDNLNKNYDCFSNPNLIPSIFEKYKTEYENIMGFELPDNNTFIEGSNELRLLNATDFFGGAIWE